MNGTTEAALNDLALLKPRQSLQNMGQKQDDDDKDGQGFQAFGPDGFTFLDFLDIVNPLQHIPVVSALYREATGDTIDPGSRIAGGTLFGGPIGAVLATADVALTAASGRDLGSHVLAFLSGGDAPAPDDVVLAEATTAGTGPSGATSLASPIPENLEVLEWAQQETALFSGMVTPPPPQVEAARAQIDDRKRTGEMISRNQHNSFTTGIAANSEVLDWARAEARQPRTEQQAQKQARTREHEVAIDTVEEKKLASGMTHAQLSGAMAPAGGWFSETMLLALSSYQESAGLGKGAGGPAPAARGIAEADFRPGD